MVTIGIDLGGTKVVGAVFDSNGNILNKAFCLLEGRSGKEVGMLVKDVINKLLNSPDYSSSQIAAIGACVPGIANSKTGKVWAPNIPGWDDYPLQKEIEEHIDNTKVKVSVASDRTCYILGETWRGNAKGCDDAIFVAVGTGIGVGILTDGRILHGHSDIVGATGWMALQKPYLEEYKTYGCFESHASGTGIALQAQKLLKSNDSTYKSSILHQKEVDIITSHDIFAAYDKNDTLAKHVIDSAIELWGMASANYVSLFNPAKIIWGGGVFGPAVKFIDRIYEEACRWAQPISIKQVSFEPSALSGDAGLLGAGHLAMLSLKD